MRRPGAKGSDWVAAESVGTVIAWLCTKGGALHRLTRTAYPPVLDSAIGGGTLPAALLGTLVAQPVSAFTDQADTQWPLTMLPS
jgi:hypothetical protein